MVLEKIEFDFKNRESKGFNSILHIFETHHIFEMKFHLKQDARSAARKFPPQVVLQLHKFEVQE